MTNFAERKGRGEEMHIFLLLKREKGLVHLRPGPDALSILSQPDRESLSRRKSQTAAAKREEFHLSSWVLLSPVICKAWPGKSNCEIIARLTIKAAGDDSRVTYFSPGSEEEGPTEAQCKKFIDRACGRDKNKEKEGTAVRGESRLKRKPTDQVNYV